jgi:hypothetical protein
MTTPVVYPSAKQFMGMSKETTMGTAVTPNTVTYPINEFQPKDDPNWLMDEALRGSMVSEYGMIQGALKGEFSGNGPAFLDVIGNVLLNILGGLTTSGPVSSVYSHEFTVLNSGTGQPPSHTLMDWQGPVGSPSFSRMYPGACISELTVKGNPETTLIEHSFKGNSWPSAIYPTAEPANAPTAATPLAAWRVALSIAGSPVLSVREWQVTIKRALRVQHNSNNTQNPYIIMRGPVTAELTMYVAKPSDESIPLRMLNNTQGAVVLTIDNGAAGAATLNMIITMTQAAFKTSEINRGDEAVGYDVTAVAIANTTDASAGGGNGYSPINILLENAIVSY